MRVPEQCSVIGFDDVATSALYTPSLTTVRQPMEAMGASAVGIVVDGINGVLEKREISATPSQSRPGVGGARVDPQLAVERDASGAVPCIPPSDFGRTFCKGCNPCAYDRFFLDSSCPIKALFIRFNSPSRVSIQPGRCVRQQ